MTPSREAYDLFHAACRRHVWRRLKRGHWRSLRFLRLVISDTINRVCTPK